MRREQADGVWGIILAGGDGKRLHSLTTRIEGDARPKQFCRLLGDETLLRQTRRRIDPLIGASKTITVVTKKHEPYYARELSDGPRAPVLVQPENRGTAVAIGASILMLKDLQPDAVVVVFPSDHHYNNEAGFLDVVESAIAAARDQSRAIILVGAEPSYPETEYGWIEPLQKQTSFSAARVRRFWEKPTPATAQDLLRRGCLWNTFLIAGQVNSLLEALCESAPNTMLTLAAGMLKGELESCYRSIPSLDFSRDVLAHRPERLLVVRDSVSGWTDVGSPDRVVATLARDKIAPAWFESGMLFESRSDGW